MTEKTHQTIMHEFPKQRSILPEAYQQIYSNHYKSNRDGGTSAASLSQKMEAWMHKKVAADLKNKIPESTLEIGAGTLNQLQYEADTVYDIIEPFKDLFKDAPELKKINSIYTDISEIENKKYERITSVATFEHITNLPYVVAKTCTLLNKGGTLRVAIPNEGTILWKLGWMFTTGLEFKFKYNLKYSTLLYHEHVNSANDIEVVLKHFYSDIKCNVFGIHKSLGLYRFYECRNPKYDIANTFLENEKHS